MTDFVACVPPLLLATQTKVCKERSCYRVGCGSRVHERRGSADEMQFSFLIFTLVTAVSAIDLKGISPSQVDAYKTPITGTVPSRWKCLNSSQEIPHSAVNDNYCDCEDGTDEPGKFTIMTCPGASS